MMTVTLNALRIGARRAQTHRTGRGSSDDGSTGRPTMNVLVYLVPMALGLGLAGLFAFLWAVRHNQFDDAEGSAARVLFDDDIGK